MLPRKIVCILVVLITALALFGCAGENKYVQLVKNGSMQMEPNIKIGKAFDDFFGNPKWKYFEASDRSKVVEFNGECTWWGNDAHCTIQFLINSETTFELGAVEINGQAMNVVDSASILHKALTNRDE